MVTGKNSIIIGYLSDNGLVEDEVQKKLGKIKNDGTIFDPENKLLGTIKTDGTVLNQNSEIIGFAKNIPIKWAAVYFLF